MKLACSSSSFEALKVQFANQSEDFKIHGLIFSYLIKPDLLDTATTQLDLGLLGRWILMILKCSTLNLRHHNRLMDIKTRRIAENCFIKSAANLNCWTSLPEAFIYMKKFAFVLLSTSDITYTCEQIFLSYESCFKFVMKSPISLCEAETDQNL